jgi:hypothetical protein
VAEGYHPVHAHGRELRTKARVATKSGSKSIKIVDPEASSKAAIQIIESEVHPIMPGTLS